MLITKVTRKIPESLENVGIAPQLSDGSPLQLDPETMVLTVTTQKGDIIFTPALDEQGHIVWSCANGEGLKPMHLPASCRSTE